MTQAGVLICPNCRDNSGDNCSDYCGLSHVEGLPPLWLSYWPTCQCCGQPMKLLETLTAVVT